jgi:hypothetical protein
MRPRHVVVAGEDRLHIESMNAVRLRSPLLAVALCATVSLFAPPAHASAISGSVLAPTFGSPALQRNVQETVGQPGVFGFVIDTSAMHSFAVKPVSGLTGQEQYDIFFYSSLDAGVADTPLQWDPSQMSGQVPAGARYAIVTLALGADGSFEFDYS